MDAAEALGEVEPQEVVETPAETPAVETETGAKEETEETTEKVEAAEETEESTKVEETTESPSVETHKPVMVEISAMHGERDRRQALETEFDAYKKAHPDKDPEPAPSIFDDEQGALDHRDKVLGETLMNTLLNEGKAEAIGQHGAETVDAAEKWFVAEAQKSPMLANQLQGTSYMQQHRKVVDMYKAEMSRADADKNPAEHDARLKALGVEEYLAKLKADSEGKQKVIDSIPKSLVGDSSAGTIQSSDWSGPTPLESIISDR